MHCNEDWARFQESSDVWWRTPPASSEGPQANMGPMADAVETEEGPRFVHHNQSRTHVEHADARLQKIGLCYVIEWTWLWFWLAWLADYRGSERFDIFHAWWSWEMKLWYGVTGYLMTFQPKRQIPNTGSSQRIVRLVFLFFAKSFWQSVHCT